MGGEGGMAWDSEPIDNTEDHWKEIILEKIHAWKKLRHLYKVLILSDIALIVCFPQLKYW